MNMTETREFPYRANETMKLLGKQVPLQIITGDIEKQMNDVVEARKFTTTLITAMDMFMLGYIHGKRAERARRKAAHHEHGQD